MKTNLTSSLNLLTLLRSSYKVVSKMIPLSNKIGTILFKPLAYNIMLAKGRISRLAGGIAITHMFINHVLDMHRAHGASFTIKWLKGCHVAICKVLAQNKLLSLRQLTEDLPLPRLVNGLPSIIPFHDRMRIRRGHVPTIRFYLGLFNLYRVLKAPGELKLGSITSAWTGKGLGLLSLLRLTKVWNPFLLDPKIAEKASKVREKMVPTQFVLSRSASPSNSVSMYGILTDAYLISKSHLAEPLSRYLSLCGASKFQFELDYAKELAERLKELNGEGEPLIGRKSGLAIIPPSLKFKTSIVAHGVHPATGGLSQFAIKEEAAGKIRLFALVDNITQSVLRPLHDALFDVLSVIPTDSTFNQDAGVYRAQDKAMKANKAFSFDLSSATDRLPVLLSMYILRNFIGKELASLWRIIIVNRTFAFNDKVAKSLGVDNSGVRYRVGQPMGAYTSWAMLAITHHWIVQAAARIVDPARRTWFTEYEVLGDDIVIFDEHVAREYQVILSTLGCDINLTKSILAPKRPVFEFAKRVCWGWANVSGVSLNQVQAGWRVSGRVANALSFASAGLLENSKSLLLAVLSRNAFSGGKVLGSIRTSSVRDQKAFALGVLALLGQRFQVGKLSLREVMHAIIDPKGPIDLDRNAIAIPIQAASTLAYSALVEQTKPAYPFSHEWDREPKFLEMEDKVATEMLHSSINKLKQLKDNFDFLIECGAQQLWMGWTYRDPEHMFKDVPYSDLPSHHLALLTEIEQFYSMVLGFEMTKLHPQFLYKELFMLMDSMLLYEEAVEIVDKVDALVQRLEIVFPKKNVQETTIVETAPLLMTVKGILGSHSRKLWLQPTLQTQGCIHNSNKAPKGVKIPDKGPVRPAKAGGKNNK